MVDKLKSKKLWMSLGVLIVSAFFLVPAVNSYKIYEIAEILFPANPIYSSIYEWGDPCSCADDSDGCCVGKFICVMLQAGPNQGDYVIGMECQGPHGDECQMRGDGVPYCPFGPALQTETFIETLNTIN